MHELSVVCPVRKNRAPRIKEYSLRETRIDLPSLPGENLQVSNLSYSGFALLLPNGKSIENTGKIPVTLHFPEHIFSLQAEIIRVQEGALAGKFITDSTDLRLFLQKKFKAEYLALNLVSLSRSQLKHTPEGEPHWFYDGRENELYFIIHAEKIIYMRIQTLGYVLEYFESKPLQMRKIPRIESGSMRMPGTRILGEATVITPEFLSEIHKFIHHIDPMEEQRRNQILEIVS